MACLTTSNIDFKLKWKFKMQTSFYESLYWDWASHLFVEWQPFPAIPCSDIIAC